MESKIQEARNRKASGKYNCAQAVACTYAPALGVDEEAIRNITNAFGRGMGNMEGTCGSIVGAGVILGIATADRSVAMQGMKRIMERFKERNSSTVCRQLKGIDTGCPLRACNDCVADSAEFLEDELRALAPRWRRIAVMAAMDKEVNLLRDLLGPDAVVSAAGHVDLIIGRLGNAEIAIAKSGIGKVNAALATRAVIDYFHPDAVVSTGVAGGTGNKAGILDVVVADRLAYHDVWCGPGTEPCVPDGFGPYFTADANLLALPALEPRQGVFRGLICSGDSFISKPGEVAEIRRKQPEVMAVEMESTAIAHVCASEGIPFVAVRVVSDTPGAHADNASQYETFWDDAPKRTFAVVSSLLDEMTSTTAK